MFIVGAVIALGTSRCGLFYLDMNHFNLNFSSRFIDHGFLRAIILFLILLPLTVSSAEQQLLQAAQSMIRDGKPLEAFDLLSPYEFENAGETEYDYLLGLSLLDSGEPGKSVFAFQRVLAIDPNFAGARLELARAYFDMSEYNLSRSEFNALQSQSPPPNIELVINKYLAAIRNRTLSQKQGWSGYVQLGLGSDSNANSATDANTFLGFSLSDKSRETKSSVISTIGGVSYDLPVNYFRTYYLRSNLNHLSNNDASFASSFSYDLSTGLRQSFRNGDSLGASVQVYSADVDGRFNNKGANLSGQYSLNFSASNQLGFFMRLGEVDYVESFDVKDVTQAVAGVSWSHIFGSSARPSLVASLIHGQDDEKLTGSPYGRSYDGIRLIGAVAITHQVNLFTSIGTNSSSYDGQFFGLPDLREDDYSDISLGASWRFNKNWTLKTLVNVIENSSNIDIFSYEKTEVLFYARSDFGP